MVSERMGKGKALSSNTHRRLHFDNLEPPIQLWHKVRRSAKGDGAGTDESPPQSRVLPNAFAEGTTLK